MNILVIGSGGREHALCWKLSSSAVVEKLYCAPGNGGTSALAVNVDLPVSNHPKVIDFCREKDIDLVVVGPEIPLAEGIADDLQDAGIGVFGPSRSAARMESDKIFAKEFMRKYKIPTAEFSVFDDFRKAEEYIRSVGAPVVIKAYGLAAGKGVVVAENTDEAVKTAEDMLIKRTFGDAGARIVVEECLNGEEASILVVTDGKNIIPLASSQDHKRAYDGDSGPNTGGMGAYSPAPVINDALFEEIIEKAVRPVIDGLNSEGITYRGILYAGLMITMSGPKVLEYNVRFGDPETQVILPRLRSDLAQLLTAASSGSLSGVDVEWDERECVCVVMASGGYPGSYEKGKHITGLDKITGGDILVFHAGTRIKNDKLVTSGGRVLNVVGMGTGIAEAVDNTYKAVEKIYFDGMHYRKDIGYRALEHWNI